MIEVDERLVNYLDNHSSIIKLTIDAKGIITHANVFAERLAGRQLESSHISTFFTEFNANLDLEKIVSEEIDNSLINVNTNQNLPETFYFTSFKIPEGMVLIGELNSAESEKIRKIMISLNNELNNLTRELQKKNVQLDQLNNLKNQFLGMAAHDLRNPISTILMFSEFIMESDKYKVSDNLQRIIEVIKTSSEFMLGLLEELLDVVKIESGQLQLNLELTDLEEFLRKNTDVNKLLAAKKEIKLVLNIPQPLPKMKIDANKIEQVLNNLISNAIKYSHNHTAVTISAFSSGAHVMISVEDQGQGIPENEIGKIFMPFSKISVKGTAGEKSTGLGLSIVKRIVTGHKGRIWVESKVGKGSVFHFTLPHRE